MSNVFIIDMICRLAMAWFQLALPSLFGFRLGVCLRIFLVLFHIWREILFDREVMANVANCPIVMKITAGFHLNWSVWHLCGEERNDQTTILNISDRAKEPYISGSYTRGRENTRLSKLSVCIIYIIIEYWFYIPYFINV